MIFPEKFRQRESGPYSSKEGDTFGYFLISPQKLGKTKTSRALKVIAADGYVEEAPGSLVNTGWAHASVSLLRSLECPSWDEMMLIRKLFWEPEACVIQFGPPEKEHISIHPGCLHWWQFTAGPTPMPPTFMV